jgi:hypothetical protein
VLVPVFYPLASATSIFPLVKFIFCLFFDFSFTVLIFIL